MPILYIHGVATRSRDGFVEIERYLRRLVAPGISPDPDGALIDDVFWGDVAATFFWDGASRPKSRLLGMGVEGPDPCGRKCPHCHSICQYVSAAASNAQSGTSHWRVDRRGGSSSVHRADPAPPQRPVSRRSE